MTMNTDDRIDYLEQQANLSRLTAAQVAGVQAYLLGAVLTHFDEVPVIPMTESRWHRIVRDAIDNANRA